MNKIIGALVLAVAGVVIAQDLRRRVRAAVRAFVSPQDTEAQVVLRDAEGNTVARVSNIW